MASACSSVVPTGTVTRFSLVMTSEMGRSKRFSKRRSRLVRMPTSLPPLVTGTPEMRNRLMSSQAAEMGWSGPMVMGSTIMPLSLRLTRSTLRPALDGHVAMDDANAALLRQRGWPGATR